KYCPHTSFSELEPGFMLPDLRLFGIGGEEVHLSDFSGQRVVIETGSMTCPSFVKNIELMNELRATFDPVEFVVLYVREAHPGGRIRPHSSMEQKLAYARELVAKHGVQRRVLVDTLKGDAHAYFGNMPNACLLLDEYRRIIFRSTWARPSDLQFILSGL